MPAPQTAARFTAAKPIWPEGREKDVNLLVGFRAVIDAPAGGGPAVLRLAASCLYRATVNGQFVGHGPARAGHGFYRVDEWDIAPLLAAGANVVAVEVASYNAISYYTLNQPGFLQAEVVSGGRALAATGTRRGFAAFVLTERVRKVVRYSWQRTFSEYYRLRPAWDAWRTAARPGRRGERCAVQPAKPLLPRGVPYPSRAVWRPTAVVSAGTLVDAPPEERKYEWLGVAPKIDGFTEEELEVRPWVEIDALVSQPDAAVALAAAAAEQPCHMDARTYRILDLGRNRTGFIGLHVRCEKPARVMLSFDETLIDGDVKWRRMGGINLVGFDLAAGEYDLETLEPYTLRHLKLHVLKGSAEIGGVYLRELAHGDAQRARFACGDDRLNRIFEAGRETFAQNTLDVFMDCPSRERAGWLCDAFFTARVELDLCGRVPVETAFFENYLLPAKFEHIPEGMLPKCYPADSRVDGTYIPNWAMWFVVQLAEYALRGGRRDIVDGLRPRVDALFAFLRKFENSTGLLEKLPSWVFVEWSEANKFVQDVNYPSNMLYAGALDAAARLYGGEDYAGRAAAVREEIRRQSFDGEFFVDNALRKPDGTLEVTGNRTETCQYYAFFFDVATPQTHPGLWQTIVSRFGPRRRQTGDLPEIHPSNAFIGNFLRADVLARYGQCAQVLAEAVDHLLPMADRTGTLWEHQELRASLNHGFASHACHILFRDALGVQIDPAARRVRLLLTPLQLDWCAGRVPVGDGAVELRWRRDGGLLVCRLGLPAGYTLEIDNRTGLEIVWE